MIFFKPKFWDKNQISFFAILFLPIALLIKFLTSLKHLIIKTKKYSIPVVCVGNIYVGGTGKTPLCIELFSIFKELRKNPAFIRKKYNSYEDEVKLQESIGALYQEKKRSLALHEAIKNNVDIAILDDGFQDLSIKKDFSIVCFNERQWIGNGLIMPSGPLRENLFALKRAQCVMINGKQNKDIENKILNINRSIKIFYANYKPQNINEFINRKFVAFAGIGNPENFFNLLKDNKIETMEEIKFPDHYKYSEKDLVNLSNKAKKNNAILLTTEKDYFRINEDYKKNINFIKIKIEIEGRNQFIEEIKKFT